ncbi:cupin domain-containing protein [Anaerofilum sp. BX8]|uniref:Cupin domain-containing protein n=1 Tax=Anaerofilum hominis TaxID=2763016 RepID=A0A923I521_9FIRM|nr:cupin domain-containing protein [Anaerofilum hominis]MBC5580471.1 cupin domain-containing protein [Anaerofilum hominis]
MGKKVFAYKSKEITQYPGAYSWEYFSEEESACKGFKAMMNHFYNEEYIVPYGLHEDNEGFYVVSGKGKMIIGSEEYDLAPGVAMLAPAHVPHAIKKTSCEELEIFLFHFPVIEK